MEEGRDEDEDENQGKIRKRRCSSDSSSSLARKYRFKRAILVGRRVRGLGTPVPTPKMAMSRSSVSGKGTEFLKFPTSSASNARDGVVSARRLAATLWEMNDLSSPHAKKKSGRAEDGTKREIGKMSPVGSSDPALDTVPEVIGFGFDRCRRRKWAPESQKLQREVNGSFSSNGSLLEMETKKTRPQFKDVCKALITAKELLKVLSHIWRLEEKHSSSAKWLVSALRAELDRAIVQVDELAHEQREMKYAMRHWAEERAELEGERKELAEEKDKAVRELERAWEEVGKEREMLQFADILREERFQMKMAEAKFHFEEKNADFEKLKCELEAYTNTNRDEPEAETRPGSGSSQEELRAFLRKTLGKACQNPNMEAEDEDENGEGDDSGESDLHSIQLEPDGRRRSLKWGGYSDSPPGSGQDDSKRSSVEVFKGRKSLSEKIQWATISLLKGSSALNKADTAAQDGNIKLRSQCRKKEAEEDEMKKHRSVKSLKKQIMSGFKLGSSRQGFSNSSPANQWGLAIERS